MCAGRATHQPTSNGGKNSMSQEKRRFEASAKHCRLFKKKALSAPGREWGTALRADSSSTGSTKSESHLSVLLAFP